MLVSRAGRIGYRPRGGGQAGVVTADQHAHVDPAGGRHNGAGSGDRRRVLQHHQAGGSGSGRSGAGDPAAEQHAGGTGGQGRGYGVPSKVHRFLLFHPGGGSTNGGAGRDTITLSPSVGSASSNRRLQPFISS